MDAQRSPHLLAGAQAEAAALAFLRSRGLELVERNFRARTGEIDIVMRDSELLVFVEVRYRKHASHGGGAGSVDTRKRNRLARTAALYLCVRDVPSSRACRFDVVALGPTPSNIEWFRDAFEVEP